MVNVWGLLKKGGNKVNKYDKWNYAAIGWCAAFSFRATVDGKMGVLVLFLGIIVLNILVILLKPSGD